MDAAYLRVFRSRIVCVIFLSVGLTGKASAGWEPPVIVSQIGELTYYLVSGYFSDKQSASDACVAYKVSLGHSSSLCNYGPGYEPPVPNLSAGWQAGWLYVEQDTDFYLVNAYFPYHYIAPEVDSTCEVSEAEGDPCDPTTGRMYQTEHDYHSADSHLGFQRYYSSWPNYDGNHDLGEHWRHNYSSRMGHVESNNYVRKSTQSIRGAYYSEKQQACELGWNFIWQKAYRGLYPSTAASYIDDHCVLTDNAGHSRVIPMYPSFNGGSSYSGIEVIRDNGVTFFFQLENGVWEEQNGRPVQLVDNGSSWAFIDEHQVEDTYIDGQLVSREYPSGEILSMEYSDQKLIRVSSTRGGEIAFSYLNDALDQITIPGGSIQFAYQSDNLTSVTYPDGSSRQYHYEDTSLPYHMTGLTDENGVRFVTWAYDSNGRATLSTHPNDIGRVDLSYNDATSTTTVTETTGAQRTYKMAIAGSDVKVDSITGDRCKNCPRGQLADRMYDTNGYLTSGSDWNGSVTNFVREAERGLVLSRTEGAGTLEERTILTEWHPDYRLPTKITYPDKIVDFVYDGNGNLLSRTESTNSP